MGGKIPKAVHQPKTLLGRPSGGSLLAPTTPNPPPVPVWSPGANGESGWEAALPPPGHLVSRRGGERGRSVS